MQPKSIRIVSQPTTTRQTPAPKSRQFREALAQTANNVLHGAASLIPGVSVLTSNVSLPQGTSGIAQRSLMTGGGTSGLASRARIGGTGTGTGTGATTAAAASGADMFEDSSAQAAELIQTQIKMNSEQRYYQTISNVLKSKHDTSKSVINNLA